MAEKAIYVWRYDYELKEGANWVAHVAGYTENETRDYLWKIVGKNIRITGISQVCRLDAITDEFRNVIVEASMPKKKRPGRPPKAKTEAKTKTVVKTKISKKE